MITPDEYENWVARRDYYYTIDSPIERPLRPPTKCDPIGQVEWDSEYKALRAQGMPHEEACVRILDAIYAIEHPGTPVEPPVVPPGPGTPLVGPLRIAGGTFADDTGPVTPTLCHFGEAFSAYLRRKADVLTQLDVIAAAGYHGIRFWDVLGYYGAAWGGKEVTPISFINRAGQSVPATPHYYAQLGAFLADVKARGLAVHHSRGDLNSWPTSERLRHCQEVRAVQRQVGISVALNESCNEAWQNGVGTAGELVHMAAALTGETLQALSCPPGAEEEPGPLTEYSQPPADVMYVHGYRGGLSHDRIRHIFSLGYEKPTPHRLGWQGEPAGPGAGVTVGQENHPEALALMAAMSFIARQAWVYMSGHGVFWIAPIKGDIEELGEQKAVFSASQDWDFTKHQPGFLEVAKVKTWIPRDVMTYQRLCHGGVTWRGTRVCVGNADGTLRADHALHDDGRCVIALYGLPGTWDVGFEKAFTGHVVHPATGAATPLQVPAGQSRAVTFERGRVLVGTRS